MKANCVYCSVEFDCKGAEKYCSIECRKNARREREKTDSLVPKICPNCNTSFVPQKRNDQVYCCNVCRDQFKWKKRKIPLIERICPVCGTAFTPATGKQICCSGKCTQRRIYLRNPEKSKEQSRRWRQENPERAKENDRRKRERNKERYQEIDKRYHDLTRFGGNREKAMERDGYKCVICGATEDLGVHHKDFSGQTDKPNNELDNLMTVCKSCHTNIHIPRLNTTPHVTKQCKCCGKEIRVSQARINDGRGKYCSEECANKAKDKKTTIICAHCGKEFQVTLSRLKRGKVKFCSMECRKAAGYAWTNK